MRATAAVSRVSCLCAVVVGLLVCVAGRGAEFAGGTGTPGDPYRIATAEQLRAIGSDPELLAKHYALVAEIDLDPNLPGGRVFSEAVIGKLSGGFDGRGHIIRNLTVRSESARALGLLAGISAGAWVRNLGVEDVDIAIEGPSSFLGGLAGENRGLALGCSVSGSVTTGAGSAGVGGLFGYAGGDTVACYSSAAVSAGDASTYIGSLTGRLDTGNLSGCYAGGRVTTGSDCRFVGPLTGGISSFGGTITVSFWDNEMISASASSGGIGLPTERMQAIETYLDAGWDFAGERANGLAELWTMPAEGGYPQLAAFSAGRESHELAGSGTPDDPYLIETPEDLGAMWRADWHACFALAGDIDLGKVIWLGALVPRLLGTFDGAGFVVSDLQIQGGANLGLFGFVGPEAVVTDLTLEQVHVVTGYGAECVAGLAARSEGRVVNCHVTGHVSGKGGSESLGGLVGENSGVITDCSAAGTLKGYDGYRMGGLVGANEGRIIGSHASVEVSGADNRWVGGLVGDNDYATIKRCYATGNVSGAGHAWEYGGLAGGASGVISECYATGDVSATGWGDGVGGLVGGTCWGCRIANCYATGDVSGGDGSDDLGGLLGYNWLSSIANCYALGRVSSGAGSEYVGGLVGVNTASSAVNCLWDIETSGTSESAAGTGLSSAEMQDVQTYLMGGWDLVGERSNGTCEPWYMPAEGGYLMLSAFADAVQRPVLVGEGTAEEPYQIGSPEDLGAMAHYDPSAAYELVADLDLSDIVWSVAPVQDFDGTFDGGGHVISNLTVCGGQHLGLFGALGEGAEVTRLGIQDATITGGDYASRLGGLAGSSEGRITGCFVTGHLSAGSDCEYLGGFVGRNRGTIQDCGADTVVTGGPGSERLGGFVGIMWGLIANCRATGDVCAGDKSRFAGGFVGNIQDGTIADCYATGAVLGGREVNDVGGFAGSGFDGVVDMCYSAGSISVGQESRRVGGFLGADSGGTFSRCLWDVQASGMASSAAGKGLTTAEMMDPEVLGLNGWGGDPNWVLDPGNDYPRLAGEGTIGQTIPEPVMDWFEGDGTEENPYSVDTANQLALIGTATYLWDKCFVLGADLDLAGVTVPRIGTGPGSEFVGRFDGRGHVLRNLTLDAGEAGVSCLGLFGYIGSGGCVGHLGLENVTVEGSYDLGPLAGINGGTITHCYARGSVTGPDSSAGLGGLVGSNTGTLTQCFADCRVSAGDRSARIGGLAGANSGVIENSYAWGDVSGGSRSWFLGGLVGYGDRGTFTNCYAATAVSGGGESSYVDGFLGYVGQGSVRGGPRVFITGCYCLASPDDAGPDNGSATALTSEQMKQQASFADWDFETIWMICEGQEYPRLRWEGIACEGQ